MLKGNRNYQDGLWDMQITKTSIQDNNHYSILNQTQHQDSISSQQDILYSKQQVDNGVKTTSHRIRPSFLKHISIIADENRFHNVLEQFKI